MKSGMASLQPALERLVTKSYQWMELYYGPASDHVLQFHDRTHAFDVVRAASGIGNLALVRGNITVPELAIVTIAAAGHDLIHGKKKPGKDEQLSSKLMCSWMKETGAFSKKQIGRVGRVILSTINTIDESGIHQSAGDDYLEKILCDADLSSFGMPPHRSKIRSEKILHEIHGEAATNPEVRRSFLEKQLILFANHKWYTEEAAVLFPYKDQNIAAIKAELAV